MGLTRQIVASVVLVCSLMCQGWATVNGAAIDLCCDEHHAPEQSDESAPAGEPTGCHCLCAGAVLLDNRATADALQRVDVPIGLPASLHFTSPFPEFQALRLGESGGPTPSAGNALRTRLESYLL